MLFSGKSLAKNTAMLYVLTAANYVFGLVTVPYLTRVLGVETYGAVGFAQAGSIYMQMLMDFGFILSATAAVSQCDGNAEKISQRLSEVTFCKAVLGVACLGIVFAACLLVPSVGEEWPLFLLFYAYALVNSFIPDFVYRGIERMEVVTYRTVAIKAIFVALVFCFVKGPEDYLLVPLFYLLGAASAIVAVYAHLYRVLGYRIRWTGVTPVLCVMKQSSHYFVSRIASTFYTALNTMVIGVVCPGSNQLGYFTAVDKVISAGKSASSPIADSLYPYMIRTNNFKLLVKLAVLGASALAVACIPIWVFAEPLCLLFFGEEYAPVAPLLRILLPLVPISMVSYLFGFPALSPLGKTGLANLSVEIGAVAQILLLTALFVSGAFSIEGVCVVTVMTEACVLAIRIGGFVNAYRKMSDEY